MPKLSPQTLEQRTPCPHCQKTFKNLAGLSGHIQYKHKSDNTKDETPCHIVLAKSVIAKLRAEKTGFNPPQISEIGELFISWEAVKAVLEDDNIKLNNNDLKTYLIVSMAQIKANQLLYQKLQKELGATILALLKIKSETTPKFDEKELREYPCQ